LWFLTRDKSNGLVRAERLRDRRGETLFIDARKLGTMETRTLRVLTEAHVAKIADAYTSGARPEIAMPTSRASADRRPSKRSPHKVMC
jgi:type I restriction-modification system DNA methylase subunit